MKVSKTASKIALQAFFIPWLAVLGLRYSGVITYSKVDGTVFLLFGLFVLPFLIIAFFVLFAQGGRASGLAEHEYRGNPYGSGRVFNLVVLLTFAYLVAVVIDKVFLADVLTQGITEARYAAMEDGPRNSLLGAVHYFLAGAPVLLGCLLLSRRNSGPLANAFLWGVVVLCFGCFFLSGGRNSFVVGSVFLFFYFMLEKINFRWRGVGRSRKFNFPIWLKFLSVLGAFYVMYLFVERAQIRGMDLEGAVHALAENYNVKVVTPSFLSGALLQVYYIFVFVLFYVTHSLSYVSSYFELDYSPMTWGGYSFSIILRVVDALFGTTYVSDAFESLLVAGVYLTLPGSIYVDFGFLGVFVFGVFLAWSTVFFVTRALWSGDGNSMMAASLCLTVVALSPVFSALSVGNGFSIMMLLVFIHLIGRRKKVMDRPRL